MATKKKVEEYMTGIITNMLRLCKMKVPCVIAFHYQGKSQQFGTHFARQHLVKYKSELRRALAEDALSLCSRNDDQGEPLMSTNMELSEREKPMSHFKQLFKISETACQARAVES